MVARVMRMALFGAFDWRKVPLSKREVLMDATHCAQRKVTFEDEGNTVMLRGAQLALVAARQGLRQSSPTAPGRAALLGGSEGE